MERLLSYLAKNRPATRATAETVAKVAVCAAGLTVMVGGTGIAFAGLGSKMAVRAYACAAEVQPPGQRAATAFSAAVIAAALKPAAAVARTAAVFMMR